MDFWLPLAERLNALLSCNHSRARVVEGKTYCPDCGHGVIFRWVILKCVECHQRRPSRYQARQVVPAHRCCTFCGERAFTRQILCDPEYYQLRHALLSFETEPVENPWIEMGETLIRLLQETLSAVVRHWEETPRLPAHSSPYGG